MGRVGAGRYLRHKVDPRTHLEWCPHPEGGEVCLRFCRGEGAGAGEGGGMGRSLRPPSEGRVVSLRSAICLTSREYFFHTIVRTHPLSDAV
jgi:hypothetical protein